MSFTLISGLLFAALLGLCIGSFYTAAASRILYYVYGPGRKEKSRIRLFLARPSFCMECGVDIRPLDLIPFFSYIFRGGQCANCGAKIGPLTFMGETFCGLLFPLLLYAGLYAGYSWPAALCGTLLCGHLYISIATDYNLFLLDYENTLIIFILALVGALFFADFTMEAFLPFVYTSLTVFAIFFLLWLFTLRRGAMGFGDVLLAGSVALYVGFPFSLILFQVASAGAIVYVYLIKRDRHTLIPFGVFIAGGVFITIVGKAFYDILG